MSDNEILGENETPIENIDTSDITLGCIEEDPVEEVAGSLDDIPKGIYGGGPDGGGTPATFHNKFFNQLEISPWSCFYMANWTALCNTFNVYVPMIAIKSGWMDLVSNGKFIPGVGGKMSDGTFYALKHFNLYTGKNVRSVIVPFSEKNRVSALKSGSCFVFGLKYGKTFQKNEQDDGIIQDIAGTSGGQGHLVCGVKENNLGDDLGKYAEQYHGKISHDIILLDYAKYPELFMNNLTYFVG
jgi:hypothetical protein